MSLRLGWDKDTIADRITLTLPDSFAKDHESSIWKLMRSIAEMFYVNTDGIDGLFQQTNISTASGEYLDEYVQELSGIRRKEDETDDQLRVRHFRNAFTYNGTKNGVKEITYDVVGYYPLLLNGKERGAYNDALYYYNDARGGSVYGGASEAYVGYIVLNTAPTEAQMDELCALLNRHKKLGIKLYIKHKQYGDFTGDTYSEIAEQIMGQTAVKQLGLTPYGDFYDGRSYYDDTNYPAFYGGDQEDNFYKYLYLNRVPTDNELDQLCEALADNLNAGDHIRLFYKQS